jgi:hypothetical protein
LQGNLGYEKFSQISAVQKVFGNLFFAPRVARVLMLGSAVSHRIIPFPSQKQRKLVRVRLSGHAVLQADQGSKFLPGKDFSRVYSGVRPGFDKLPDTNPVNESFRNARDAFFALEVVSPAEFSKYAAVVFGNEVVRSDFVLEQSEHAGKRADRIFFGIRNPQGVFAVIDAAPLFHDDGLIDPIGRKRFSKSLDVGASGYLGVVRIFRRFPIFVALAPSFPR